MKTLAFLIGAALAVAQTSTPGATQPGGSSGAIQANGGGVFSSATNQQIGTVMQPHYSFWVGGTYPGIASAAAACEAALGVSAGTCDIYDYNLPHSLNVQPWKADHTENHTYRLHLGPGVLTLCDSSPDPDGNSCSAGFSFATGNQGAFIGTGTSKSTADTNTIIRAGAGMTAQNFPAGTVNTSGTAVTLATGTNFSTAGWKGQLMTIAGTDYVISSVTDSTHLVLTTSAGTQTGAAFTVGQPVMVTWGDISTDQDAFGAQIRDIEVDCNNKSGLSGIINTSTQELSLIQNVDIRNCQGAHLWMTSVKANNSEMDNVNITFGTSLKSSSIGVLFANAAPKKLAHVTIQGGTNGYQPPISSITYSLSGSAGSYTADIGGLTVDTTKINTNLGPNGTPSYIMLQSTSGASSKWNTVFKVTAVTASTITIAVPDSIQSAGTPTNGAGTVYLVPTFGMIACAGDCTNYNSDAGASGIAVATIDGLHMEKIGVGLELTTSSTALAVDGKSVTCNQYAESCIQIENNSGIRNAFFRNSSTSNPYLINDLLLGYKHTGSYLGEYWSGTSPSTQPGLMVSGVPHSYIERAAPPTGVIASGRSVMYADSTAHRLKLSNAGGTSSQVMVLSDMPTSAAGVKTDGSGNPSAAVAATDFTLGAPMWFMCGGVATSSTTIFLPSTATAVACTQTGATVKVPLQTGHVVKNLRVRVGNNGVSGSSGVVTLLVNSATSTTLTCTLGTGNTCTDLTHTYTVVNGDVFYVSVTTQGSETLGNIAVSFEVL